MKNRSLFLALFVSSVVVLASSCTSHQRSPALTGDSAPAAVSGGSTAASSPSAPAATSKSSTPARASAAIMSRGGDSQTPGRPSELDLAALAKAEAQAQTGDGGPIVMPAVRFGESPAARDIPAARVEADVPDLVGPSKEGPENPEIRKLVPSATTLGIKKGDAALQSAAAITAVTPPIVSFDGLNNTDNFNAFGGRVVPPDDNGDVGPNHYVQQINLLVRVFSKAGAPLTPPFKLSSLFAPIGGQCAASDPGDPIVLYDPLADRWLLSQFGFLGSTLPPYHQCIAISKTADPTGAYYLYDFVSPNREFPDYPHLGVWPDGYYMMVHQFTNGGPFNGTGFYAFDRKKMLAGDQTASYIYFNFNLTTHPEGVGGSLPSDIDGLTPPPVGRPNTFAYLLSTHFGDALDALRLFDFHADFAVPANSTLTERPESPLPVAAFDPTNPGGRGDIPQPPPSNIQSRGLDSIADRLMSRMTYRNFGGYESLVVNHTVGAPASTTFGTFRAGVRYYELRRPLPSGNFVVNEQATYAPADGVNRWMASAAEDHEGNIGVGFSVSSTSVFPGIRYAGRLASDPPGGLFQGEATLIAGTGVQTTTLNRWGDYSGLTVDPSDDCTFWYTNEYYTAASQATSTAGFLTRIGSFKVNPSCVPAPMGTLNGTVTFCDTGAPADGALVEISDGHTAPVTAAGTYSIALSPGTYSVTVKGRSCTPTSPVSVVITNGGTTTYSTCVSGSPAFHVNSTLVTGGNANGIIDKDECNTLFVTLANTGCARDTGITATLTSSTPGVFVDSAPVSYPNMNENGTGTNTPGFLVSTSPSFVCGTTIAFTMTVSGSGGTQTVPFTMPSCATATTPFSGSITLGDPTQAGRLSRNGVESECGDPKPTPPVDAIVDPTGLRHYDSYTYTNNGGVSACITVRLTSGCSTNVFTAAYLGSFNPANIHQNYLADPGVSSAGTVQYSFDVPAGATFVVVVHEVTPNQGCASYSGTVSGLLTNTDGGGVCPTLLTALSPAEVWIGLKNSDDVGTRFDLKAEVYKNGTLIGLGETDNVPGGSSGFNNAVERSIALALTAPVTFVTGDQLSIKLYARIGATGHRSGTARLWFNDAQADTEFDTTIGGVDQDWYIRAGGGLETTPGPGPKKTIDLFLDRLVGGNPFKLFGTWTHTF